jgi:PAS domain S-box-containing protein
MKKQDNEKSHGENEQAVEMQQRIARLQESFDVHQRVAYAAGLFQGEVTVRTLIGSLAEGLVVIDQEGVIILVNRRIEEMFGYTREEIVGQTLDILIPERFTQVHSHHIRTYFHEPHIRSMGLGLDLAATRKDGTEFPVEISLSFLDTEAGRFALAFVADVSLRKQTEARLGLQAEELARSNKELEQFAYVASHDLQEPLRMVGSYMQLLAERYQGQLDERAERYIAYAVDGANRMKRLIDDLLAYSRAGTQSTALVPTDSQAVLEDVLGGLQVAIEEKQATVTYDPLPTVLADEVQLGQVFQNLIANALKFSNEAPPRIHVGAQRDAERGAWRFSVADNGIGLDPKFAERIFVIFQRLHGPTEYPGTGMGLAICKKIVERHGGRMWVESQPGQGATFYFTLPGV